MRFLIGFLIRLLIRFLAFPDLGKASPDKAVANSERMLNACQEV
jgi:hypothetical protein